MKYIIVAIWTLILIGSCKKENHENPDLKEGIISHMVEADCGYLLWVDSIMYKISNEAVVYNVCKDRMYTNVLVDYEILDGLSSITCPMYTNNTQAQQVKLTSVVEK